MASSQRHSIAALRVALVISGAHQQCKQYQVAVDELVAREVLDERSTVELLYGDGDAVMSHLG